MKKLLLTTLLSCTFIGNAIAAGDADSGKTKAAVCAACHGSNGIGIADNYPNLAGQQTDYIVKQLKSFKDGSRKDPVMAPMAMPLSDQDMLDVAAYFATFTITGESKGGSTTASEAAPATTPVAAAPVALGDAAAGKALYIKGDAANGVAACVGCHGEGGDSKVLINPNLSKQHPEYIAKQLNHFKDGSRVDPSMTVVGNNLSTQNILDLEAYFKSPDVDAKAVVVKKASVAKLNFVGDVEAGKAKSAVCASCHGVDGNALVPMYPSIAGQHEKYIAKQLADFKAGPEGRNDPVMAGMVAALSETDMQDLAAYFASQKIKPSAVAANAKGKSLYQGGDAERGVTACIACHGVDGNGAALAGFPKVASQSVDYLKSQLSKFRDGSRNNDMSSMMTNIAAKLTDEDVAALAEYMSSLK